MTRVAVVGHVEWVQFAVVERVPVSGEIVHARETFAEPAGGGAVAVVQLRKLAGAARFLTALGDDGYAQQVLRRLDELGVEVHAGERPTPQRRTFTFLDDAGERTITVLGERIVPWTSDPLPWDELAQFDGIYLTGGDAGAVRAARAARALVATPRAIEALAGSGVRLDVLVRSANDPGEAYEPGMLDPAPRFVVSTRG
ncbi:MAG: ribokinase, partial [Actinobacteria bacterium]|nr:ribokinase [Actinomycetota bacterium]